MLYPALVYVGMSYLGVTWIAIALFAICFLRLVVFRFARAPALGATQLVVICCGGIALAVIGAVGDSPDAMLLYPVFVNAVMLALFAWSVARPPTIVERIARLREPDLSTDAVPYLRRVTIAWIVFFVCNGAVALYTALQTSLQTWAFYNGFVAYVLIGAMFGGEFLTRMRVMRKRAK